MSMSNVPWTRSPDLSAINHSIRKNNPSPPDCRAKPTEVKIRANFTFFACFLTLADRFFATLTIAALPATDKTRFLTPLKGACRKAFLAAKAKENVTEKSATESNNRKVISMVENIISGLYLVGDVALLGLLVYKSHKPHNKTKRGCSNIHESQPTRGLRQQLHGSQRPQGKR
jgi:hypothetical protein